MGLRNAFPNTRIALITTVDVASFGRTLTIFDDIITIDSRSLPSLARSSARALFRGMLSDCVLDLEIKQERERRGVAIGVGCSSLARERMLDADQWLEVISRRVTREPSLAEAVWFLGGPEDAPLAEKIVTGLVARGYFHDVSNLCGTLPLEGSLALMARAREFWGIDSALVHYARLFGAHRVSFWGPTSPACLLKPVPFPEEVHYASIACSPCVHVAESPPCEGRNLCMTSLLRPLTEPERRELPPVLRRSSDAS